MTTHESAVGSETILAQQVWLQRLSRELVRDDAAAEDLAQEVLVTALAHPPRHGGALRAWLRTVLLHRVRDRVTAERRRRGREEQAARPEAVAGPAEILERLDLAQRVAEALAELPEPERRVLYLRYYEDLSPPDVARVLRLPLGTVKSRLARGRELLRQRLDRECGGRSAWATVLLPLARIAPAPLPAPHVPLAPAAATAAPLFLGALIMGAKTTAVLVASAALAASLIVWSPWEPRPAVTAVALEPAVALDPARLDADATAARDARDELALTERVALEARQAAAPSLSTTGGVELAATYSSDGAPGALVQGHLAPEREAWRGRDSPAARRFALDHEGRAQVDGLEPGVWVAGLDGRSVANARVEIAAGETARAELTIHAGLAVRGEVLDEAGVAVPGAEIFLAYADVPESGTLAVCDGAGRFTARDLAPWQQTGPFTQIAARAAGRVTSRAWVAVGAVGEIVELVLRLGPAAGALRGRVVDSNGVPVAGARIELGSVGYERHISPEGRELRARPPLHLASGPDGAFATDRLPLGHAGISVRTDEHPTWQGRTTIEAGRAAELEVVLRAGGMLEGVVLGPDGEPAEGASVSFGFSEPGAERRSTQTDAEGRYLIRGLDAGSAEAHAKPGHGRGVKADVWIRPLERTRWDVRLPASDRVTGFLLDETGEPLASWYVHVIEPSNDGLWYASARTDGAGRFALENCPEGPKALEVRLPAPFAAPPLLIVPFPEEEEVTLVVPDRARPSATLQGRVVDPDGGDLDGLEVWLGAEGFNWAKHALPDRATQSFVLGPLAAGPYQLSLQAPGYVKRTVEGLEITPGELRDLGALEPQRGAMLEVTLTDRSGGPGPSGATAQLLARDGTPWGSWSLDGPTSLSELLPPGEWLLRVGGSAVAQQEMDVRLVAGQTTAVELAVEPGVRRKLLLEGLEARDDVTLEVFDADGEPFRGPVTRHGQHVGIHGLTPGRWRVFARTSSGRTGELDFSSESTELPSEPLVLHLR